ncbi:MAG: outer membrane beta-barrel protein [Syntrophothermus sp.]
MRKWYAVLLSILLILGLTPEKQFSQFRLKLGPQTGLNFNIGTGSDMPKTSSGFGFFIGGTVDMNFSPMVGLITNLQFYDNRSSSFSESDTFQGIKYTVENSSSIAYFMIEPLFKLSIPRSGFYFVMGPAVGFNVQATGEAKITSANDQITFNDGSTKQSSSIDNMNARFEVKLGAGYDIDLGPLYLTPQLTFGYGITEVREELSARILTIQALVAVKFNLI